MKAEAMRAKSADELKEMVMELRKEQMNLRFRKSAQQLDKTHTLSVVRRDIARAKTLINEAKNGTPVKKPAKVAKPKTEKPAAAETPKEKKSKPAAKKTTKPKAEKE
jgi:large subunit ribosomal protein L29